MRRPFLVGSEIYLRPMELGDVGGPYLSWLNDREITIYTETGTFPTTAEQLEKYIRDTARGPDNVMLAIALRHNDEHIGNIKLGPINWLHRRGDMGILIGSRESWGHGYGTDAVRLIVDYAFATLGLHKVTLGVYADHGAAIRSYEKVGFRPEGTLKEHLFRDGRFYDKLVMGVLASEWIQAQKERSSEK